MLGDARSRLLDTATSHWDSWVAGTIKDKKGVHNATPTGLTYGDDAVLGSHAIFDGSTSKLSLGFADNLTEFTFFMRVKMNAFPASGNRYTLLSKNSFYGLTLYDFPFQSEIVLAGELYTRVDSGGDAVTDTAFLSVSKTAINVVQTIVVSVKEADTIKVCLNQNSVESANLPGTMVNNAQNFTFGAPSQLNSVDANTCYFAGELYEIVFWTQQLTDDEMILL
jgi:hypothetical protein